MNKDQNKEAFFAFLQKCSASDDRATLSNLRCLLRKNLKQRAWPFVGKFGGIEDESKEYDHYAKVVQTIAGLYAAHPSECNDDFGLTCRKLMRDDEKLADSKDIGPIARRFQLLLSSEKEEICDRTVRMVLRMKTQEIPVNYHELYNGLMNWGDKIKNRWAGSFWNVPELEESTL